MMRIFELHRPLKPVFHTKMPRPKKNFSDIAAYSNRADMLIGELEKEIAALKKQIEGVQRKIEEKDREIADLLAVKRALPRMANGRRVGRPPGKAKPDTRKDSAQSTDQADAAPNSTSSTTVPPETQSMAGLIRKLALSQTGRFTPSTITDLIRTNYPEVFKRMPPNYTSSNLWKLADSKKKPIRIVESGGPGGSNVYEVSHRQPNVGA